MRLDPGPSWRITIEQWSAAHDCALWFRAVERIPVPAGGLVPGPLDIEPVPAPSSRSGEDLAADWWRWWDALVEVREPLPSGDRPPSPVFGPPDLAGVGRWPGLHQVVSARWREAYDWHNRRKGAGLRALRQRAGGPGVGDGALVKDVGRALGRPVPPFDLEIFVLPVVDDEVREVSPSRYLVPEAVFAGPGWRDRLRPIVTRLVSG